MRAIIYSFGGLNTGDTLLGVLQRKLLSYVVVVFVVVVVCVNASKLLKKMIASSWGNEQKDQKLGKILLKNG